MSKPKSKTPMIIGIAAGGCLLFCICAGAIGLIVYAMNKKGPGGTTADSTGTAAAISSLNLLMEGGSSDWDSAVKPLMVSGFDGNGSGEIDTADEVAKVDCATWAALDAGVKEKWEYGLRTIYGFHKDYAWIGNAVGFSESVRPQADTALAGCLGEPASFDGVAVAPVAPVVPAPTGGIDAVIRAFPDGGSSEWDEKVKGVVLASYDADHSGAVNTAAEVASIPCATWKAMDDGVKSKYTYGIRSIYGFEAGYSWIGYAVGIDESMRTVADAALVGCGCGGGA